MKQVISIDIGGTSTKLGLVNQQEGILCRSHFNTWSGKTEGDYFNQLFQHLDVYFSDEKKELISGIGIDAPSCIPEKGIIKRASNLPFSEEVPIVDIIKRRFKKPVFLCNDANAAAVGEGQFGGARGMKNYAVITLGTGLGCGIVVNGSLLTGQSGLSAELGHVIARRNGRQCLCGKKGCLETYASARGIKRNFLVLLAETNLNSSLENLPVSKITARDIAQAAQQKDKVAMAAIELSGKILGEQLSNFIHLFEPEAVFLAGGVMASGETLLNPIKKSLHVNLLPNYKEHFQIMISELGENEAALLGTGALVFKKLTGQ